MLIEIIKQSLMITGFVFTMMLVIEYLNILSKGEWEKSLMKHKWGQWFLSSFLGSTPGCLGAFAVISLYMHRVISFGALTGGMIATCGDESFVMLAMFPKQALIIFGTLFVLGVVVGMITDLLFKGRFTKPTKHLEQYAAVHSEQARCVPFSRKEIGTQWKNCSPQRGWLTLFLLIFLTGIISGQFEHKHLGEVSTPDHIECNTEHDHQTDDHTVHESHDAHAEHPTHSEDIHTEDGNWNWIRVTLLLTGLIGLFIIISVPDHFLEEHLWNHIAKIHIWRIFLWTLGALFLVKLLLSHAHIADIINQNHIPMLIMACLLGIIPESGPHLIFVTLFAEGAAPLSILLASSIAQDGHGMIPLLSHSRLAFLGVKAINILVALAVGLLGYYMGW